MKNKPEDWTRVMQSRIDFYLEGGSSFAVVKPLGSEASSDLIKQKFKKYSNFLGRKEDKVLERSLHNLCAYDVGITISKYLSSLEETELKTKKKELMQSFNCK